MLTYRTQFQTVDDVPKSFFQNQKSIYAYTERVIDGDTIRVRHIPSYNWIRRTPVPLEKRALSDCTLSIRIYGVDTPEIAKNKNQKSQAFGDEAKDFTTQRCLHKMMRITFLRKDQYHRAVCVVETVGGAWRRCCWPWSLPKDLSVALAQEGLAELYTGGSAEYFNNRELLERKISRAKNKKLGIWSLGDARVSAAEHKRNGNRGSVPVPAVATASSSSSSSRSARGGAQTATSKKPGRSSSNKQKTTSKENRGSTVMETVVTGLEFVA
jgi:endonuclease YncB( thermonuclease family)